MSEEKKLTDEDIVKALEFCLNRELYCDECPLHDKHYPCLCANKLKEESLDLIHRLQDEKEELKQTKFGNWKVKFFKAQEEIERLTEELQEADESIKYSDELLGKRREEISKLKKQVDELKLFEEKYNDLAKKYMNDTKTADYIRHRAVKATAKEILENLYYAIDGGSFWLEETGRKTDLVKAEDMLAYMRKKAEEYGVELDE